MTFFRVESLTVDFGGIRALDGVTFELRPGEALSLIGPNGAGKTTVFNVVSRLSQPSAGRVTFQDQELTRLAPHLVPRRGIARTFQNIELFEQATVLQNLLLGRHVHRRTRLWHEALFLSRVRRQEIAERERVEQVIDFLDLQRHREQPVGDLPYGVRKMVELGRALCLQPTLLLLDEPSSGLNPEETEDLVFHLDDIRHDLGITLLLVEHHMGLVGEVSDRVVALSSGRVLTEGTPEQVQNHPDVIAAYLGEPA